MNERMKVLKMVEEGKITAQEAAQLLEAIGQPKKKGDVSSKIVESVMDGISGVVGGAFSIALGEEKEMKVEKGDELVVKSVGSSVNLSLHSSDDLLIKPAGGLVKTKKENSEISVKIVGGSAELLCPQVLAMTIKDAGGSVDGEGTATLTLKQLGGTANLTFKEIKDVCIDSKGGTVTLYLGDCGVAFDIAAPDGDIDFDIPAEFEIKEDEQVKGKIKNGKGSLIIRASSGSVKVLPIKAKEKK